MFCHTDLNKCTYSNSSLIPPENNITQEHANRFCSFELKGKPHCFSRLQQRGKLFI